MCILHMWHVRLFTCCECPWETRTISINHVRACGFLGVTVDRMFRNVCAARVFPWQNSELTYMMNREILLFFSLAPTSQSVNNKICDSSITLNGHSMRNWNDGKCDVTPFHSIEFTLLCTAWSARYSHMVTALLQVACHCCPHQIKKVAAAASVAANDWIE